MRAPHESVFDHALDTATHTALGVLGLRAEDMVDLADSLNEELEPVFQNWVDSAGEAGIPEGDGDVVIARATPDADEVDSRIAEAARAAVEVFGIDADLAPETTQEVEEAISRIITLYLVPEEDDLDL